MGEDHHDHPGVHGMKLTTTLYRLRMCGACADQYRACDAGYQILIGALGPDWPDNRPIDLLQILDLSGAEYALWSLRAAREPERGRIARLIAADCVEMVLHIFEAEFPRDTRPRRAITVSRKFAMGEATSDQLRTARIAARDAASAATRYTVAAWDAIPTAIRDATSETAYVTWDALRRARAAASAASDVASTGAASKKDSRYTTGHASRAVSAAIEAAGASALVKITTIIRGYME